MPRPPLFFAFVLAASVVHACTTTTSPTGSGRLPGDVGDDEPTDSGARVDAAAKDSAPFEEEDAEGAPVDASSDVKEQ